MTRSKIRLVAAALGVALVSVSAAQAAPFALSDSARVQTFSERLKTYAFASRVRWILAARTREDAETVKAEVGRDLGSSLGYLADRIDPQSFAESGAGLDENGPPLAWMTAKDERAPGSACSWQVLVSDPNFPGPTGGSAPVPLAPLDKLPVSSQATFRVVYSGIVQSRIYAFDETKPGAIRDLTSVPDLNIPVAVASGATETILLATARNSAPFYDKMLSALKASNGRRVELGEQFRISSSLGDPRSIGSNIQLVPKDMVKARNDGPDTKTKPDAARVAAENGLMETCMYSLTAAE